MRGTAKRAANSVACHCVRCLNVSGSFGRSLRFLRMYGLDSSTYDIFETTKSSNWLSLCRFVLRHHCQVQVQRGVRVLRHIHYHSAKSIRWLFATKMDSGHLRNKDSKIEHSCRTALTTMCEQRQNSSKARSFCCQCCVAKVPRLEATVHAFIRASRSSKLSSETLGMHFAHNVVGSRTEARCVTRSS